MQQVVAAVGEDDGFVFLFPTLPLLDQRGASIEAVHRLQCNQRFPATPVEARCRSPYTGVVKLAILAITAAALASAQEYRISMPAGTDRVEWSAPGIGWD